MPRTYALDNLYGAFFACEHQPITARQVLTLPPSTHSHSTPRHPFDFPSPHTSTLPSLSVSLSGFASLPAPCT